mmetsp:Transcript_41526/g.118767  ORF Transcript_41526/g.118767 Transcript_41526/m.118767 type:complete len:226 (-) Transcript_41526:53-730(-)
MLAAAAAFGLCLAATFWPPSLGGFGGGGGGPCGMLLAAVGTRGACGREACTGCCRCSPAFEEEPAASVGRALDAMPNSAATAGATLAPEPSAPPPEKAPKPAALLGASLISLRSTRMSSNACCTCSSLRPRPSATTSQAVSARSSTSASTLSKSSVLWHWATTCIRFQGGNAGLAAPKTRKVAPGWLPLKWTKLAPPTPSKAALNRSPAGSTTSGNHTRTHLPVA